MHSGQKVKLRLRPAAPDTGIAFRPVDLATRVDIPVRVDSVGDTRMASTISVGGDPGGVESLASISPAKFLAADGRLHGVESFDL
jgi:UDP-3-O-[3-hydroxymyristoyl] N-acetylglucosamine deacetylase